MHNLVDSLLVGRKIVPEHGGVLEVGLGVPLLRMDEQREFRRISQEEDWSIVVNPVPVTLVSVELHGEASRIPSSVGRALFASDGRETNYGVGLLANTAEHISGGEVTDIVSDLKLSVSAGTLGVNYSLRDALACGTVSIWFGIA